MRTPIDDMVTAVSRDELSMESEAGLQPSLRTLVACVQLLEALREEGFEGCTLGPGVRIVVHTTEPVAGQPLSPGLGRRALLTTERVEVLVVGPLGRVV